MKRNLVVLLIIALVGGLLVFGMQGSVSKVGPAEKQNVTETLDQYMKNWREHYAERPFSQAELIRSLSFTKDEFFKAYNKGRLFHLEEHGISEGYYYRPFGVSVSFAEDGRLLWVDCRDGFELNGVKAGMSLDKVKTILGEAPVRPDQLAGGRKVFILEYTLEDCVVQFISFDRGGTDDGTSFLRVLPRRDVQSRIKQAIKRLTDAARGKELAREIGSPAENPVKSGWGRREYRESPLSKNELVGLVSMTKGEILRKYGYDYEVVRTGPEGLLQGYFFRQLGVCITFKADGSVGSIEFSEGVGIDGVSPGTNLDEVRAKLGEGPVHTVYIEGSIKTYVMEYPVGDAVFVLMSYQMRPNNYVSRAMIVPRSTQPHGDEKMDTSASVPAAAPTEKRESVAQKVLAKKDQTKASSDAPGNKTRYQIIAETHVVFDDSMDVAIRYPQIVSLGDDERQRRLNELIKKEALPTEFLSHSANHDRLFTLPIDYKITWQSDSMLSIQYKGMGYVKGEPHPNHFFYTSNIDIANVKKLVLKDLVNIDEGFVEKFRSEDIKTVSPHPGKLSGKHIFVELTPFKTIEDTINLFNSADVVDSKGRLPGIYWYFTPDSFGISKSVIFAIGGHAEFEIKYADIAKHIKAENEVWHEFFPVAGRGKH